MFFMVAVRQMRKPPLLGDQMSITVVSVCYLIITMPLSAPRALLIHIHTHTKQFQGQREGAVGPDNSQ